MKSVVFAMILLAALIIPILNSGLVKPVLADSVIGNPILVGSGPYKDAFDPDNGDIYVANLDSASVSVINGSTNKVVTNVAGVAAPRDLAYDSADHKMFVADVQGSTIPRAGAITVINTTSNTLIDKISAGSVTDGVVYDSSNGNVYAINAGSPVTVIKASNDKAVAVKMH